MRLPIDTKDQTSSIRISFTDQRLTAHGGRVVWSHFLHQKRFRRQLREVLPHCPTSPNAYDPTDVALGYVGGIQARGTNQREPRSGTGLSSIAPATEETAIPR